MRYFKMIQTTPYPFLLLGYSRGYIDTDGGILKAVQPVCLLAHSLLSKSTASTSSNMFAGMPSELYLEGQICI